MNPYLLRVFTNDQGNYGDPTSVVIDEGRRIPDQERRSITRKLNTVETIFINNLETANISVMHPHGEIGFAGVAVVGVAYLLAKLRGRPTEKMIGRDDTIIVWQEDGLTWARANLSSMPPWNYKQLASAQAVEEIKLKDMATMEHVMAWAWIDEAKGLIRARTFATDWNIPEPEGNGSGALVLAAKLKRAIEVRHGKGSVMFAKPAQSGYADIGGRVVEGRTYEA